MRLSQLFTDREVAMTQKKHKTFACSPRCNRTDQLLERYLEGIFIYVVYSEGFWSSMLSLIHHVVYSSSFFRVLAAMLINTLTNAPHIQVAE